LHRTLLIKICGEVKHVGFRQYVWRSAKRHGLRGYVRNIPSSNCVEVIAQGQREVLEQFISRITSPPFFDVEKYRVEEADVEEEYSDFEIL